MTSASIAAGGALFSAEILTGPTAAWDQFVAAQEHATFCHLGAWRDHLHATLRHQSSYWVARDAKGEIQAVLPLCRIRNPVFGHQLISLPYLNYGGALGTPAARARLIDLVLEWARDHGVDRLVLRDRHTAAALPAAGPKVTVVLPLPETVEALWSEVFRAKLRSQIRRPIKEGMEVRYGAAEAAPFYDVFRRNMRDLGTPVHPRAFFDQLPGRFGEHVLFGVVYHQGRAVAGGCGFLWRGEFEMTWASSLREVNALSPNMLLYASFMEEVIRRGGTRFNFGRCNPGGGTHRFKLQWGGTDVALPWTAWERRAAARPDDHEPGSALTLASRAWRRLPLAVTDRLGPVLARLLPHY